MRQFVYLLTHRGRVMHICVGEPTIIGSVIGIDTEIEVIVVSFPGRCDTTMTSISVSISILS